MNGKNTIKAGACLLACCLAHSARGDTGCTIQIRAQPLDDALQELARQCDAQMIYFSGITAGLMAPDLSGRYTLDAALHLLLDKRGLSFHHVNAQTIQIERDAALGSSAAGSDAARPDRPEVPVDTARPQPPAEIPEVVINTTAQGLVATRIETPLRDIPQSISITSQEQIRQQNNFDLSQTLDDVPGLTAVRVNSLYEEFLARGFALTNYTLDGGGTLQPFQHLAQSSLGLILLAPNLAEIDHVEILQGSDALFGADAAPGGMVNLIRKRPLGTDHLSTSTSVGSWNDYRQEVDATGPLGFEGALRGRVDVTYRHRDYFYNTANEEPASLFGVLDYDVTPSTLLTVGGSYSRDRAVPFQQGLPWLSNGADPHLPRDTSYTFDWTSYDTRVRDAYVQLDQSLGDLWRLQLNAMSLRQSVSYTYGSFTSDIDATTGGIPTSPVVAKVDPASQNQLVLQVTLTGKAQWLGLHEDLAVGGDFRHARATVLTGATLFGAPLANAYQFQSTDYPDPLSGSPLSPDLLQTATNILSGWFTSMRVELNPHWYVTTGLRVSNERYREGYVIDPVYSSQQNFEYNGKVTPFVGTQWALDDTYTLYASYADIYQGNDGVFTSGSNLLHPSDGITFEGGIKGAWRKGALNGSLVFYQTIQKGLGVFTEPAPDYESYCCYAPAGRYVSKGIDVSLSGELTSRWLLGSGYSYNNNAQVVPDSGRLNTLTPRHLLKLWTSYTLPGEWYRWSVGGSLRAQSSIFNRVTACTLEDALGNCLTEYVNSTIVQKSYAVVSPRVAYQFNAHWQLAATVNNILDRRYYQTLGSISGGNWYGDPRGFLLRLDGRF